MNNNLIKIVDDPKIKTSELIAECKKKFDVWSYWSDKELNEYFPAPQTETTRYFKNQVEPDLLNTSCDDMEEKGIQNITLRERIIMELSYFNETGDHLDILGWTITSSRCDHGVASADWDPGYRWFRVDSGGRVARGPDGGGREAISLNPSTPSSLEPENPAYLKISEEFQKINDKLDTLLNNFGLEEFAKNRMKNRIK